MRFFKLQQKVRDILKSLSGINMNEDKIRTYDELNVDEKEVLDFFRQMKLSSDYNKFRFFNLKVENLIEKYEQLKRLREEIQSDYFSLYDEIASEELIEGELDASDWGITREHENEVWDAELRLWSEIKAHFDLAIKMIESSELTNLLLMLKILYSITN